MPTRVLAQAHVCARAHTHTHTHSQHSHNSWHSLSLSGYSMHACTSRMLDHKAPAQAAAEAAAAMAAAVHGTAHDTHMHSQWRATGCQGFGTCVANLQHKRTHARTHTHTCVYARSTHACTNPTFATSYCSARIVAFLRDSTSSSRPLTCSSGRVVGLLQQNRLLSNGTILQRRSAFTTAKGL